ncbi:protein NRT1/ PTR FAMILY 5.6 isoform X1 [Amborella trichopoda]|nr:protein NRT1/ PTR FAMILY 5.6 isoform X1 [Amborella trichopoda]|eukprot:XP_006845418.2 protein NRT1/ PTR FAMILY 5.6 isoform X1 [Amborella trichopoda]
MLLGLEAMARSERKQEQGWKAAAFIIGVEFGERLAYYTIASNLITFLTGELQKGLAVAAQSVNTWMGVTTIVPLAGAFLADTYFGRYRMVLYSTFVYIMGLALMTLTVSIPFFKTAIKIQGAFFYLGLYLVSVGTGGHKPCLQAFGADQFEEADSEEVRREKASFFNWWFAILALGVVVAATVVVYVQDNVGWGLGYGIPTMTMVITLIVFMFGSPFYVCVRPEGSPLTSVAQVLVAAFHKRGLVHPLDPSLLHEDSSVGEGKRLLDHTNTLRFLDKAAIKDSSIDLKDSNPWTLCTLTQVEETKLVMRMVPIWTTCLALGITIAQSTTFFIKQGATMDRSVFHNFKIPAASLIAVSAFTGFLFSIIYDYCFHKKSKETLNLTLTLTLTQRIGIGLFLSISTTGVAALVETRRLHVAPHHLMSVFWLVPQFFLLGITDVFALVGIQEFFYTQMPDSMRSQGMALYLSVIGVGSFLSSFVISVIDKGSRLGRHGSWFNNNLNMARLDYFYWCLTALNLINFGFYIYVARKYTYKKVKEGVANGPSAA